MLGYGHAHVRVMGWNGHWLTNTISAGFKIPQDRVEDRKAWIDAYQACVPPAVRFFGQRQVLIGAASFVNLDTYDIFNNTASRTACDIGSFRRRVAVPGRESLLVQTH